MQLSSPKKELKQLQYRMTKMVSECKECISLMKEELGPNPNFFLNNSLFLAPVQPQCNPKMMEQLFL